MAGPSWAVDCTTCRCSPLLPACCSRAIEKARDVQKRLTAKYGIKFGDDDPPETHFLGANIFTAPSRHVACVRATSYIDLQVKRFADGDVSPSKRFPAHWSNLPADETLVREWEAATATRTPATPELTKRYGSLFGALFCTRSSFVRRSRLP